jgi:lysophospholipase L1-like esterase
MSEHVRSCIFFVVAMSVVAMSLAACGLAAPAAEPAPRHPDPDPLRFEPDILAFEAWDRQNSPPQDAVLFVGSSSIRMWPTAESFPDVAVINRGFGGSHTSDVNHFAERIVLKYAPRTIVFYAGDNDIADGKSPEQVAGDFERFVDVVHATLPDTEITYLPIKPSLARWPLWQRMQATNSLVQQFIDGKPRLAYVDTATPMLGPNGRPRPELFVADGLHMNAQGYQIWSDLLRDKLAAH